MKVFHSATLATLILVLLLGACSPPATPAAPAAAQAEPTKPPATPEPAPTIVPTAVPPTVAPTAVPTEIPSTEKPTARPQPTPVDVQVSQNIQYGVSQNHILDVYQPQIAGETFPTLLLIHGMESGKGELEYFANYFARRGYAVVAFNKSLGQYPTREQDSFCALAWIHANAATYGFNPEQVVPVGFSLGGALAAFLGTVDDPASLMGDCPHPLPERDYVGGVVTIAGFFDYSIYIGSGGDLITTYFGPPNEKRDEIAAASPVSWVDGSEPPFLLIHGENDSVVDPDLSVQFAAQLSEAGVEVKLAMLPNLAHAGITKSPNAMTEVQDFLASLFSD